MRKFLIAAFAVTGLALGSVSLSAKDKEGDDKGVTGILIDAKCGADKDEKAAAKHGAACALKCADAGLGVTHGDKWIKFDDKGQELAKKYLEEHKDDEHATHVHVAGKVSEDGKEIAVEEIHAAKEKEGKEKKG